MNTNDGTMKKGKTKEYPATLTLILTQETTTSRCSSCDQIKILKTYVYKIGKKIILSPRLCRDCCYGE